MVYRNDSLKVVVNEKMRGGGGLITIKNLLDKDCLYGKGRLFAHLTVKQGCSIGLHKHEGEMEAFYVISGKGVFNDNGTETVINTGDVAYTADGESHSIANNGAEDLELIALIINN